MTRSQFLLTLLAEECSETAQRASKAIRFTLAEIQHGQQLSNGSRLIYEFNDILAVMELLYEEGYLEKVIDRDAISKKKQQIIEYEKLSLKLGTIYS